MVEVKERALAEADVDELIERVERAVRHAIVNLGMNAEGARKLARVEIGYKMRDAAYRWAFRDSYSVDHVPCLREEKPIEIRGVCYYLVPRAPRSWKIIAPGLVDGRFGAIVEEAPEAD